MLSFIRSFLKSKVGVIVAIAFLVVIALLFTSGDVTNFGGGSSGSGDTKVATVGSDEVSAATLSQAMTSALERVKQEDPTMSMKAFIANKGMDDVLDGLIDRLAIATFGREHGIVAGDRLIDSEIAQIPAFKGADGKFSEDLFRQAMKQRGISEQMLRDDLAQGLIARQIMVPATVGSVMPQKLAKRYAALLSESRTGEIAVLPSVLFRPEKEPTDKEIAAYYAKNRDKFIRPERRTIRYASFGTEKFATAAKPTDKEIADRFKADAAKYKASERRRATQLIVPTEAAAKAVAAEVAGGKSLEQAAREKGLASSPIQLSSREEMAKQFSAAVANAVFSASRGSVIAPARSDLGWHVARVEEVETRPARTLAEARSEIAAELEKEKARTVVTDALEEVENEFDQGGSLVEVAKRLGVEVQTTAPLTADGRVYLKPGETVPEAVKPVLQTAFTMETEEPQLAEAEPGKTFVIYDVTDIAESAAAPLKEILPDVKASLALSKASAGAKQAALRVQAEMAKGKSMAEALRGLGKPVPPVQNVAMTRPELARMQQQQRQVPRPIALMFNMAKGTTKVQPGPNEQAWFVISLKNIVPGEVKAGDPVIEIARKQLGTMLGTEYSDALGRSIRAEVGVERNAAAISAVRSRLAGDN